VQHNRARIGQPEPLRGEPLDLTEAHHTRWVCRRRTSGFPESLAEEGVRQARHQSEASLAVLTQELFERAGISAGVARLTEERDGVPELRGLVDGR